MLYHFEAAKLFVNTVKIVHELIEIVIGIMYSQSLMGIVLFHKV